MNPPSPDITEPCLRDGRPAQPQVHHGRPENTAMGKGAGGDPTGVLDHERYDLCDDCHKALHNKEWAFRVVHGIVEILSPGDNAWVVGRRGLVLTDGWSSLKLCWTDQALAYAWAQQDKRAIVALKRQCEVAWVLKERYSHVTHKWYERAAEILGDYSGKHVHWGRVYERCHLYATFGATDEHPNGRWKQMEKLGPTVALAVAKVDAADREEALETALGMSADFQPAKEITAAIKGDSIAESAKSCEEHEWRCKHCGAEKGD